MPKRYIEATEAIRVLSEYYHHRTDAQRYVLALAISAVPTADVVDKEKYDRLLENSTIIAEALNKYQTAEGVERKKGKWIEAKPRSGLIGKVCSACGNEAYWDSDYGQQLFDWCPYCGSYNGEETENGRFD